MVVGWCLVGMPDISSSRVAFSGMVAGHDLSVCVVLLVPAVWDAAQLGGGQLGARQVRPVLAALYRHPF